MLATTSGSRAIYALIALVLFWPLINFLVVRRFRRPAHPLPVGHAYPLREAAQATAEGPAGPKPSEVKRPQAEPRHRVPSLAAPSRQTQPVDGAARETDEPPPAQRPKE